MATWCAACEDQQDAIREARAGFPADTVIVSLDVDPAGDTAALAAYAADHGYDWTFATATTELTRALVDDLGAFAVNPAATPLVLIGRDGTATLFALGHKDAATLAGLLPSDA
jgi:cytochrome oxidase Cu insertion factor (SCO1/SenC/PrrC family)